MPLAMIGVASSVSIICYLTAVVRMLPGYEFFIRGNFSSINSISLEWLRKLCMLHIGVSLALLAARIMLIADVVSYEWLRIIDLVTNAVIFYFVGIGGYHHKAIFAPDAVTLQAGYLPPSSSVGADAPVTSADAPDDAKVAREKYRRSTLSADEARSLWDRLLRHMETEEPYLDSELRLPQLAEMLDVSVHDLSQVINTFSKNNFYDFINGYRAEKSKLFIEEYAGHKRSMLTLGMDAGFSSKATFYRHFKKRFNMTPAEYRNGCLEYGRD